MKLTEHQKEVYEEILDFLEDDSDDSAQTLFGLLCGPAGVGKSSLTRNVVRYIRTQMKKQVLCVAPTHKARKVLEHFVNQKTLIPVPTCTVASLLNKTKSHSYVGTGRYKSDGGNKINSFDVFIIDEASMITDNDVYEIQKYALKYNKKLLFIGDKYQIPNPSQTFKRIGNACEKKDCIVFEKPYNLFELKVNMRQSSDNEVVEYYTKIRENLRCDTTFKPYIGRDICIYNDIEKFEEKIRELFNDSIDKLDISINTRVIVYTNMAVNHYNRLIRDILRRKKEFVVDDILMGYVNVGWPNFIIQNGQDYIIREVKSTKSHSIVLQRELYSNLVGDLVTVQEIYPSLPHTERYGDHQILFFPDIEADENYGILSELVKRAEKVNSKNSNKKDFLNYIELKNKMIFLKGVYKYGSRIETEASFRENHPLLFTSLLDVLSEEEDGSREYLDNKLAKTIDEEYPNIRQFRIQDDKAFSETEILADRFQVLEKDIDYGYSYTSHKSQGSSIKNIFIDDTDFDKIKDGWNYRMGMYEKRMKEKNQLRYVAYTRAKEKTFVLTKD